LVEVNYCFNRSIGVTFVEEVATDGFINVIVSSVDILNLLDNS